MSSIRVTTRANLTECLNVAKEVAGLLQSGVFRIVCRSTVPFDANLISSPFLFPIKGVNIEMEKFKAHILIYGHR